MKFMPFVSHYLLNNQGNFHLRFLHRLKNIAELILRLFLLPHPVRVF